MPQYCWIVGLAVSVASPVCARLAAEELSHRPNSERPNIVVVLADDLGWTDVGCYGSDFYQTPHLDRLARQGVRFTAAYSACTVCSPTRAALLTGKYPARLHITDWIAGHERPDAPLQIPAWQKHLPLEEVTLAELLHERGYTTIHLGKWHLGGPEFYPRRQGFDVAVGVGGGSPGSYFYPYRRRPDDPHAVDLAEGKKGDYLTDRLTDEAIRLLAEHRDKPLFVYLSHFAVHTPLQGKPELVEKYDKLTKPDRRHRDARYAAMVESLDQSVGRLMAELDRLELTDNTLVVFASDNGGLAPPTDNQPLRSGKGDVYEGGVRVPMIVRWPGVTPSGVECRQPVVTMDLFNTLAAAAGIATDDLPQPQDG